MGFKERLEDLLAQKEADEFRQAQLSIERKSEEAAAQKRHAESMHALLIERWDELKNKGVIDSLQELEGYLRDQSRSVHGIVLHPLQDPNTLPVEYDYSKIVGTVGASLVFDMVTQHWTNPQSYVWKELYVNVDIKTGKGSCRRGSFKNSLKQPEYSIAFQAENHGELPIVEFDLTEISKPDVESMIAKIFIEFSAPPRPNVIYTGGPRGYERQFGDRGDH